MYDLRAKRNGIMIRNKTVKVKRSARFAKRHRLNFDEYIHTSCMCVCVCV